MVEDPEGKQDEHISSPEEQHHTRQGQPHSSDEVKPRVNLQGSKEGVRKKVVVKEGHVSIGNIMNE